MKQIKKKVVCFLFCAVAGLSLTGFAACGEQGLSANNEDITVWNLQTVYAKAQDLGYEGTLEEFLATIQGKDGKDGKDGQDGENGKDGKDGQDGKDGVGIENIYVDENGHLIVQLTGKGENDLGQIVCDECLANIAKKEEREQQEALYAKFKKAYEASVAYDGAMTLTEEISFDNETNTAQEQHYTLKNTVSYDPDRLIGYMTFVGNTVETQGGEVTWGNSKDEKQKIYYSGTEYIVYQNVDGEYTSNGTTQVVKSEKQNKIFQASIKDAFAVWQDEFYYQWNNKLFPETMTALDEAYQSAAVDLVETESDEIDVHEARVTFVLEEKNDELTFIKETELTLDVLSQQSQSVEMSLRKFLS